MTNPSRVLAVLIPLALLGVATAHAQTVVNPRMVEFDPSADHAAVVDTQPMVQRYELQMFLAGASQPMSTANLGKPEPEADGKIRVDFSTLLTGWPLTDGTYEARVAALGPTGTGVSGPSNAFAFQGECSITLGSASASSPAGGMTGSVSVNAPAGCSWTAASGAAWVMLSTTSGTGAGTVGFTVAQNIQTTARAASLTIGANTFNITQAGVVPCAYALSATTAPVAASSGSGSVTLTCGASCAWTVTSSASWVVVATASGTGSATISYSYPKNNQAAPRTATLTIGGVAYTITQAGATRPTKPQKVRVIPVS